MKKNVSIVMTMLLFSLFSYAKDCNTCEPLEKLAKQNFRTDTSIKKSRDLLVSFQFSNEEATKAQEIRSYLKLSLKAVQADKMGISDEYFYNTYLLDKKAFDQEIEKMKAIDKAIIQKAIEEVDTLRKTDDQQPFNP